MKSENKTAAQVKAQIIQRINKIKPEAIFQGYDYPTNPDFNTATVAELQEFHDEIQAYAIDGIIAEMEALVEVRA
jgi:hypothetical protein